VVSVAFGPLFKFDWTHAARVLGFDDSHRRRHLGGGLGTPLYFLGPALTRTPQLNHRHQDQRERRLMAPKHRRGAQKRSRVVKRSLRIDGSKTSVTMEDAFWNALREIAALRNMHVSKLISTKIERPPGDTLSSAIRLFVLGYYGGLA
jgi:predicted DNA-binding ribbon-helix-helix protein